MSRAGYSDDLNNWELIKYRGQVASAIRGKRGQSFLKETLSILDNMDKKELAKETLATEGQFCVIGAVLKAKGKDIPDDDSAWGDPEIFANKLDVAHQLVADIIYMNDEGCYRSETPADRWTRMREWVSKQILTKKEDAQ